MARQDNGNRVSSGATDRTNAGGGSRPAAKKPVSLAIAYIAWFLTVVIGVFLVFFWRQALANLYVFFNLDRWSFALFTNSVIAILGLLWVVIALLTEAWFRKGAKSGETRSQFTRLFGAEVVLLALGILIQIVV